MSRFFSILGVVFLALTLTFSAFILLSYKKYKEYEAEIQTLVPSLLASISTQNTSDFVFMGMDLSDQDVAIFEKYAVLGRYVDCPKKERNTIDISVLGKPVAKIDAVCVFENAEARVALVLERSDTVWELTSMSITSDIYEL